MLPLMLVMLLTVVPFPLFGLMIVAEVGCSRMIRRSRDWCIRQSAT
jgi:hypothetical protein